MKICYKIYNRTKNRKTLHLGTHLYTYLVNFIGFDGTALIINSAGSRSTLKDVENSKKYHSLLRDQLLNRNENKNSNAMDEYNVRVKYITDNNFVY